MHGLSYADRVRSAQEASIRSAIEYARAANPQFFNPETKMKRTHDEARLALECLKLAQHLSATTDEALGVARDFYAFVIGPDDTSARAKIEAALDEAGVR